MFRPSAVPGISIWASEHPMLYWVACWWCSDQLSYDASSEVLAPVRSLGLRLDLACSLHLSTIGSQNHMWCLFCTDTLLDNLTVREMLMYTAEMKNPQDLPYAEKAARVDLVLSQLALLSCRNVRIGSALARGISGL